MEICINYGGVTHCFFLPIIEVPVGWGRPGPGPINYPALFQDVMILGSVSSLAKQVTDENVRGMLEEGVSASLKAAQKHAGTDVTIHAKDHKHHRS
jgi:hypothetical protein